LYNDSDGIAISDACTIDMLGDEFLQTVQMGDPVAMYEDGTVEMEACIRRDMTRSGLRHGVLPRESDLRCVSMTSGIPVRAI
jgi:hypothetical protein